MKICPRVEEVGLAEKFPEQRSSKCGPQTSNICITVGIC